MLTMNNGLGTAGPAGRKAKAALGRGEGPEETGRGTETGKGKGNSNIYLESSHLHFTLLHTLTWSFSQLASLLS